MVFLLFNKTASGETDDTNNVYKRILILTMYINIYGF